MLQCLGCGWGYLSYLSNLVSVLCTYSSVHVNCLLQALATTSYQLKGHTSTNETDIHEQDIC